MIRRVRFQRRGDRDMGSLGTPRGTSRTIPIHYDPDRFGRFSEAVAGFLGTATYLVAQTVIVIIWITINLFAVHYRWDPYPFILLNLVFSTQASYAAPLILLAQNRQADRDRVQIERDREIYSRTLADAEFLAREIAALRLSVSELATARDVMRELDRLNGEVSVLRERLEQPQV
jgi:uncharacterized membrane protein